MTDLTVNELLTALVNTEVKHTFVADSTGRILMLKSGTEPQHMNLEQLAFWATGETNEITTGL